MPNGAVAADPERLLPLAAQTITTELGIDHARQRLADPDTYQWASSPGP
ncbi:hypothetical protein OG604_50040 [Streptomyces sp. NBC_01231]|nr:hypothetical protein OG604_50040 [Streptomyces sp. NBC_01231]